VKAMRAYLIDAEQRVITEIDFTGGAEAIQQAIGCDDFTSGSRPLNGSLEDAGRPGQRRESWNARMISGE
jgi:hypothetical protein